MADAIVPSERHPSFPAPADPNVKIWRYMDFTKYVSMLEQAALYFARADKLGDPFEGSITRGSAEARFDAYARMLPANHALKVLTQTKRLGEYYRRCTYVSSWHANNVESAAMWKLYARSNEAIAVQSRFSILESLLPEYWYAGEVQYVDYNSAVFADNNIFNPLMRKRESFAHEREVRALRTEFLLNANQEPDLDGVNPKQGMWLPVSLPKLVEHVYVAPTAEDWFLELVQSITKRFGHTFPVSRSSLDETPIF